MEVYLIPKIEIDGIEFEAPDGWTILESARFLGLKIPTLCYYEGLSSWGGCRLCLVEIKDNNRKKLVSSCTFPVIEGLIIKTSSKEVIETRKQVLELLISECPTSKVLQDLASKFGLKKVRYPSRWQNCILCGLCIRICEEQMMAKAIHFVNRGKNLKVSTYLDESSEECRKCGACMKICPVVSLRCDGSHPESVLCNRCLNELQPSCLDEFSHFACWMGANGDCGNCVSNLKIINQKLNINEV